ncbi:MAG: hypothetical protein FWE84_06670, partial [Firmicutes bacterium]|nr:hypothetical protein [Bacillota bacterium]
VDLKTKISKYGADAVKGDRMLFFGVGNHGGGPTKEMLDYLDGIRGKNNYIYSSPDKFFADAASVKLPVVEGELQRHAVGCYSAHSGIKKQNRTAERCLISAEKWSAAAKYLGFASAAERKAVLDDAWGKLLFNHFHDALCGCSIKSACEDLLNTYGAVIDTTTQISGFVTQRMAAEIDTCKGLVPEKAKEQLGAPVVVFNSSGAPVKVKVRLRRKFFELFGAKDNFVAVSPDGSKTPVQKIKGEHLFPDSYDGVFAADVPPFGYKLFYIRKEEFGANTMQVYREPDRYPERSLNAVYGDFVMDNGRLTVRIDGKSFALKSVKDKTGRELMGGTARAVVLDDSDNDTWAHDVSQEAHIRNNSLGVWSSCNEFLGRDIGEFEGVSAEITENGPVRCAVRCRYVYGGSTLEQEFVLYEGEDVLHCTAHLGLRERHKTVKLAFKTHENFDSFVCETPFGFDRRAADGKECFGHRWARAGGLNFASDAKYSYSAAQNELRVVAARSALYADHGGFRDGSGECLDMGAQSFCYALWGGDNFADITAKVASLYAPFEIVFEGYHGGVRPDEESFLKVSRGIEVSAVKEAEDGDGCVVRVYDAGGKGASGEVELFGTKVQINLKPFEIKTLKYSGNKVAETDIPELNL